MPCLGRAIHPIIEVIHGSVGELHGPAHHASIFAAPEILGLPLRTKTWGLYY